MDLQPVVTYVSFSDMIDQAIRSAKSLRRFHPETLIQIVTDQSDQATDVFDVVYEFTRLDDEPRHEAKLRALVTADFSDRNLYLDADTLIIHPIDDGFTLLERFDMALVLAPVRKTGPRPDGPSLISFVDFNSGVIFYNQVGRRLIEDWQVLATRANGYRNDQPALAHLLWESNIRFTVLPSEWNARVCWPVYLQQPARILHGKPENINRAKDKINKKEGPRVYR